MSHLPVLCALDGCLDEAVPVEMATFRDRVKIRRSSTGTGERLWAMVWSRWPSLPVKRGGGRFEASRWGRGQVRAPLLRCCKPSMKIGGIYRLSRFSVPVYAHTERTVGLGDAFTTGVAKDRREQLTTDSA
jgi:hypothetical protein